MLAKKLYRREMIKNAIIITLILLFASVSTYFIYNKYKDERGIDFRTDALEVTFHEKTEDKVTLTRVTPVRDSVGLSSKAYTFTIKNHADYAVEYKVKMVTDYEEMDKDDCGEYQIPYDIIKLSIHRKKTPNQILILGELENGTATTGMIEPGEEIQYTMRFWIMENTLVTGSDLHYHGIIRVMQVDN